MKYAKVVHDTIQLRQYIRPLRLDGGRIAGRHSQGVEIVVRQLRQRIKGIFWGKIGGNAGSMSYLSNCHCTDLLSIFICDICVMETHDSSNR